MLNGIFDNDYGRNRLTGDDTIVWSVVDYTLFTSVSFNEVKALKVLGKFLILSSGVLATSVFYIVVYQILIRAIMVVYKYD